MRAGRTGDGGLLVGRAWGTGVSDIDMGEFFTLTLLVLFYYRSKSRARFGFVSGMIDLRSGRVGVSHGYVCGRVTRGLFLELWHFYCGTCWFDASGGQRDG